MFHFPAFPPHSLYIQLQVTPHNMVRGSPIRKSWPQRPVIDSTRLIADSHVLHRLLMPRHPPCALKNFNTKQSSQKLSYKTINKITTNKTQTPHTPRTGTHSSSCLQDARVHYTVPKQQPRTPNNSTPHTSPKRTSQDTMPADTGQTPKHQAPNPPNPAKGPGGQEACCLKTQQCTKHYLSHHTTHAPFQHHQPPQEGRHCVLNHTRHTTQTMPTPEPPKTTTRSPSKTRFPVLSSLTFHPRATHLHHTRAQTWATKTG